MYKKFILIFLMFSNTNSARSGDVTNALSTTVALGCGIASGYYSKHLFYENPNSNESFRIAQSWVRDFILYIRPNSKKEKWNCYGNDMRNCIIGLRTLTGILTFCLIKSLY